MNHHHGDFGVSVKTPWMARSMARYLLAEWQASADVIEVAELLTSELATNAIRLECGRPLPDPENSRAPARARPPI